MALIAPVMAAEDDYGSVADLQRGLSEPPITIESGDDKRIKEYRVNGQLYMVEIQPTKGPSYFLIDNDGDGTLETRRHNIEPDVTIPRWLILRWK